MKQKLIVIMNSNSDKNN